MFFDGYCHLLGSSACTWSETFAFRAGYKTGVTRIATYGDMGHSAHNNMVGIQWYLGDGVLKGTLHSNKMSLHAKPIITRGTSYRCLCCKEVSRNTDRCMVHVLRP